MLSCTIWIVEHLGQQIPLVFLDSLRFLEFIHWFLAFLLGGSLFSACLSSGDVQSLVGLFVNALSLHVGKLELNVFGQIIRLNSLPFVAVKLGGVKSVLDFVS